MPLYEKLTKQESGTPVSYLDAARQNLRESLLAQISIQEIAKLVQQDTQKATEEVREAISAALQKEQFAALSLQDKEKLAQELLNDVVGLGPLEIYLNDETVTEIIVNGMNSMYIERFGVMEQVPNVFESEEHIRTIIDRILAPLGRRVDEQQPFENARLARGHRINVVIAPSSLSGPLLTIRAFARKTYSLADLVAMGSLDTKAAELLADAVRTRKNIAVCGGTGSGKTTLLNALSFEIPSQERVITIEDSAELQFKGHAHVVRLEARGKNIEGTGEITIRDLLINALRMRPDRIVVGECRGAEALDMLQAMNTGHDGSLTTLHANSPEEAISRLTTMVRYGIDLPVPVIEAQIGFALDLIVHQSRTKDGSRKILAIAEVSYSRDEGLQLKDIWSAS